MPLAECLGSAESQLKRLYYTVVTWRCDVV